MVLQNLEDYAQDAKCWMIFMVPSFRVEIEQYIELHG